MLLGAWILACTLLVVVGDLLVVYLFVAALVWTQHRLWSVYDGYVRSARGR